MKTNAELATALRALAKRFSEGWHEGIEIDATDIADLCEAAAALEGDADEVKACPSNESSAD